MLHEYIKINLCFLLDIILMLTSKLSSVRYKSEMLCVKFGLYLIIQSEFCLQQI